jgi:uncharacterized protein involved in exopolysaccharide biosynthesis
MRLTADGRDVIGQHDIGRNDPGRNDPGRNDPGNSEPRRSGAASAMSSLPGGQGSAVQLLRSLVGQIPVVLICMLVMACLALAFIALMPKRYTATSEILIDPRGLQVVQNDITPRSQNNELSIAVVESQIRVVASEATLREVIRRLQLDRDPEFVEPGMLGRLADLVSTRTAGDPAELRALRALIRRTDARRALRSFVIEVNAESSDPVKAAAIADTIASVYLETEVAARAETARRAAAAVTGRLRELAGRVQEAERAAEQFKVRNNLVGTRGQFVSEQQLTELNNRLIAARGLAAEQQARVDQIRRLVQSNADPAAIAEAVQSPVITSLRAQRGEVEREEANLRATLGDRHPRVVAVREETRRYDRLIGDELRRLVTAVQGEAERARNTERALASELETLKATAVRRDDALIRLRELERDVESNRGVYEAFLVRARELQEQGSVDTTNTRIIGKAVVPRRPGGPPDIIVFAAALMAGLALGLAIALMRVFARGSAASRGQMA